MFLGPGNGNQGLRFRSGSGGGGGCIGLGLGFRGGGGDGAEDLVDAADAVEDGGFLGGRVRVEAAIGGVVGGAEVLDVKWNEIYVWNQCLIVVLLG